MYGMIPKETLAEILLYLAEKEKFDSLKDFGTISHKKFTQALTELAQELQNDSKEKLLQQDVEELLKGLKKPYKEILAKLDKADQEKLLKGFLN